MKKTMMQIATAFDANVKPGSVKQLALTSLESFVGTKATLAFISELNAKFATRNIPIYLTKHTVKTLLVSRPSENDLLGLYPGVWELPEPKKAKKLRKKPVDAESGKKQVASEIQATFHHIINSLQGAGLANFCDLDSTELFTDRSLSCSVFTKPLDLKRFLKTVIASVCLKDARKPTIKVSYGRVYLHYPYILSDKSTGYWQLLIDCVANNYRACIVYDVMVSKSTAKPKATPVGEAKSKVVTAIKEKSKTETYYVPAEINKAVCLVLEALHDELPSTLGRRFSRRSLRQGTHEVFETEFTPYRYLKVLKYILKDTIINGLYPYGSKNDASRTITVHHPFSLDDGRTGWWSLNFWFREHKWRLNIVYDRTTKKAVKPNVKEALSDQSSVSADNAKPAIQSSEKGTPKVTLPKYNPKKQKRKELIEKGQLNVIGNRVSPAKLEHQIITFLNSIPLLAFNRDVLSQEGIYEGACMPASSTSNAADVLIALRLFVLEMPNVCDTSVTLTIPEDSTATLTVPYSLDGLHLTGTWKLHLDTSRIADTNLVSVSVTVNPVFDYALHPELESIIQAFLRKLEEEKALRLFDGRPVVANESTLLFKLDPIWTLLGTCQKVIETYTPATAIGSGNLLHQNDTLTISYPFSIAGNMLTGFWSVVLNTKTKTYTVSVTFDTPDYSSK